MNYTDSGLISDHVVGVIRGAEFNGAMRNVELIRELVTVFSRSHVMLFISATNSVHFLILIILPKPRPSTV